MARVRSEATKQLLRGQVYFVALPQIGDKPLLIVSNNVRNAALPTVLAVRVTSAPKPALSSIVLLTKDDPLHGRVLCDDVLLVPKDRLKRRAGALSNASMRAVDEALKVSLAL
ncbi:MAG: type II toxin-antitoxin system PemK/MazF family toxin [Actinomycetota bacterium]|nr:type II toxin-antitoxin system PemK/MazF family toxin [Actinomycetota bacterium]